MQTNGFNPASQCSGVLQAFPARPSSTGETDFYCQAIAKLLPSYCQAGFPDSGSLRISDVRRLSIGYAVLVSR